MIDIFEYLDLKQYLRDFYAHKKEETPSFSHRVFASKAGYSGSGYYANVVSGAHAISEKYVPKFIQGLGLNSAEADYFRMLKLFDQANSAYTKQDLLQKLVALQPSRFQKLHKQQKAFFSKWYHPVLQQCLSVFVFDGQNFKELAGFITPPLNESQVKKSIQLLQSLELIIEDEEGRWLPSDKVQLGGKEVGPYPVRDFQKLMIDQSKDALDTFSPNERMFLTTTCTVDLETFDICSEMLKNVQKSVSELARDSKAHDKVMQLNIQFFPVSQQHD